MFAMYYVVDDGTRVLGTSMTSEDYQHRGILRILRPVIVKEVNRRFPSITNITWTSDNMEETVKAMRRDPTIRKLFSRVIPLFITVVQYLQDTASQLVRNGKFATGDMKMVPCFQSQFTALIFSDADVLWCNISRAENDSKQSCVSWCISLCAVW